MITFGIGLAILIVGGALYGRLCEHAFAPDDRETPAIAKADGVDFVGMPEWKNSLINLLNIAGTGPILGPIQGILFGPIALLTIPIGCVLGGAMHDYFCGMISTREGGEQMPEMLRRYTHKAVYRFYAVFVVLVLFLVGTVFIYTPGDIAATQVFGFGGTAKEPSTWIIYSVIFVYYLIATIFPIDKIIGKIYPLFGAVLLLSAVGIFAMLFIKGYPMLEVWQPWTLNGFDFGAYFTSEHFIPNFFVTVACGILSGFHATQITLVSRTITSERQGRATFYDMMIVEGFIAMVWAAATLAMIGIGAEQAGITMQYENGAWAYFANIGGALQKISATSVVGVICRSMLGPVGGIIAIIGVIILPVTSGDTALRSVRLMLADMLHVKQDKAEKRVLFSLPVFICVYALLIWSKVNPNGFNVLWRYFGWSNQTLAVFMLTCAVVYLMRNGKGKYAIMPAIPLVFYAFITTAYLLNAKVGFSLPFPVAIAGGVIFAAAVAAYAFSQGRAVQNTGEKNA